jgi:hypothetical protein
MSDIIERLRVRRNPMLDGQREEAADEIERLRLENEKLAAAMSSDGADACGALVVAEAEIERLRGLSDITRLDVMWQELVKERYATENNAARLAAEVQNLRAEIERLRGLLKEAPKYSMSMGLRRRVYKELGDE